MSGPCPICGSRAFLPFGERSLGRCAGCDSLERQRALAVLAAPVLRDGAGRACLEVGPLNPRVFGGYLQERGWEYTSADRSRRGNPLDPRAVAFVDVETDLADLGVFPDARFDLFLAQHVLEEVDAYQAALGEIARVLRPGGLAFLEIPFDRRRAVTVRKEPDRFGKVWSYGEDLVGELGRHFARVEVLPLRDGEYRGPLLACER